MAEIAAVSSYSQKTGIELITWSDLTESDTCEEFEVGGTRPLAASIQVAGTWGGATVVLQVSNDGTNFVNLEDLQGDSISLTSAGATFAEFSTSARFIRASASGGTGQSLDITVCMRG